MTTEEHYRETRRSNSGLWRPSSPVDPGEPQNAPRDVTAGETMNWVMGGGGRSPDPRGRLRGSGFCDATGKYRSRGTTIRPSCYIIDLSIIHGGADDENPPTQRALLGSPTWPTD
jgi:hypothetical protein